MQKRIDSTIEDATARACSRLPRSESLTHYGECDAAIPEVRHWAIPGMRLCVDCQAEHDRGQAKFSGYNHRDGKDNQLR